MTRIDPPPEPWGRPPRELAMLVHDIGGALNGVLGGIALIRQSKVDPETRLQVERVAAAGRALASLLAEALGTEPASAPDAPQAVDVAAFLRFVERRWSGEAREKGLTFEVASGEALPARLRADSVVLSRVVGNLIGNAIKFSERGTVRLVLEGTAEGGVHFLVQDEGPGLAEADLLDVFEYGYRPGGIAQPGQGIGLHIAKLLTERMGGRVWLANRDGGGVEAVLSLPARLCADALEVEPAPGAEDGTPEPGAPAEMGSGPNLSRVRVLLAEDNPTNQIVASQMLRSMNAMVTLAGDGVEALDRFEEGEFDLVIVDIEMPRKSGLDVIATIRRRPDRRARTPIVALTAYAMQEHRARIAEAGANALISKPIFSVEAFGRALAAHIPPASAAPAAPASVDAASDGEDPLIDAATYAGLVQAIGREMMSELLDRIIADLEAVRGNLARALDPIDTAVIRASSHILISVAGAFGAARLARRARELNAAAHAVPGGDLSGGILACLAEIGTAVDFAREQRAKC